MPYATRSTKSPIPVVANIHDLYVLHHPEAFPAWHRHSSMHFLNETVRRADHILVISECTRNDILSRYGSHLESRIHLTYLAADETFAPPPAEIADEVRDRHNLPPQYILSVATLEPRKNLDRLLDAFIRIADSVPHTLVLTGAKGWKSDHLAEKVERSGFSDRIQLLGYVDGADLPSLYFLADVFCFPSLFEGFGLPIVEAMACGCPVMTSTTSCMPEVAGDAGVLVDPLDVEAMGQTLLELLRDPNRRQALSTKGMERANRFSWETCAKETLAVYERAAG